MSDQHKLAIAGYGYLGKSLCSAFQSTNISVAKIYNRSPEPLSGLPQSLATTAQKEFLTSIVGLDLIVELAHPDITRKMGESILQQADYMPCSITAFADDKLIDRLLSVASESGTRLYIPHGAVVGLDNLIETRDNWEQAKITFRKPPASIGMPNAPQADETILFEGSVREIADKFPRNVNAMVACALATVGLDTARARIVADRRQGNVLRGEFEFIGKDGSRLSIAKEEPAVGVSSPGMVSSIKGSILRALEATSDGLCFV